MAGKAIVINGLVVSNPLETVTFKGVDTILASYLSKNATISTDEKAALKTFVGGLLDAELWDKVKYFYPLLGSAVADQLVEVVNPDTEDLFNTNLSGTSFTSGLSVSNRKLLAVSRSLSNPYPSLTTSRFKSIDFRDAGIIAASSHTGTTASDTPNSSVLTLLPRLQGNNIIAGLDGASGSSNYRYPLIYAGENNSSQVEYPTGSSDGGNQLSYLERILLADYNGNTANLYKDKTVYKTGTNYAVSDANGYRLKSLLNNGSANNLYYGFFAITEHLSADEWGAFYDLLLVFLKAVSKHS